MKQRFIKSQRENGMNENRILSASDFMSRFTNIDFSKSDKLTNVWKKVVSKISVTKFESDNSEKKIEKNQNPWRKRKTQISYC